MAPAEVADKRAKRLCFECDGKFGPGHRCPDKTLKVIMVNEGEERSDSEDETTAEHVHLDVVEVSAQSIVGFITPHTMKLRGKIGDRTVVVLIDSGATHNLVALHVVRSLGISITGKKGTGVVMGNGKVDRSYGVCKGLLLSLPGIDVVDDFYPLEPRAGEYRRYFEYCLVASIRGDADKLDRADHGFLVRWAPGDITGRTGIETLRDVTSGISSFSTQY